MMSTHISFWFVDTSCFIGWIVKAVFISTCWTTHITFFIFVGSSCTNFSAKSRGEMNYHIAKKHSKAISRIVHRCIKCDKDFHGFYKTREHTQKEHGAKRFSEAPNVDVAQLMRDLDDNSLKEQLETCKHFLVDSEMENGRNRVYKFAIDTLDPKHL